MKTIQTHERNGQEIRFAAPDTPDAFINTKMYSLGLNKEGVELFWISSWGGNGVLIDEKGNHRIYDCGEDFIYSVIAENDDTLWFSVNLEKMMRLSLDTSEKEYFDTGSPAAFVTRGMVYDPGSKLIFVTGDCHGALGVKGVVFNVETRETVTILDDVSKDHYMASSFAAPDGTYNILVLCPEITIIKWNPLACDHIRSVRFKCGPQGFKRYYATMIVDDEDRIVFPGLGRYNQIDMKMEPETEPNVDRIEHLFGLKKGVFYSVRRVSDIGTAIDVLDRSANRVSMLIPMIRHGTPLGTILSRNGKIISFCRHGDFYRFDADSGQLELSLNLKVTVQTVNSVIRLDDRRFLGTAWITFRFWERDVETGVGKDLGPINGQAHKLWNLGGKIYACVYAGHNGGGSLVEYDPSRPANYPENPRIVAAPPYSNRPSSYANDQRFLYYSCSAPYGKLGGTITRFDTKTHTYTWRSNIIPDCNFSPFILIKEKKVLIGGACCCADSGSSVPTEPRGWIQKLDASDLSELGRHPIGEAWRVNHIASVGNGRLVVIVKQWRPPVAKNPFKWFEMDVDDFSIPKESAWSVTPDEFGVGFNGQLFDTSQPEIFAYARFSNIELWNLRTFTKLGVIYDKSGDLEEFTKAEAHGHDLFLKKQRPHGSEVVCLANIL